MRIQPLRDLSTSRTTKVVLVLPVVVLLLTGCFKDQVNTLEQQSEKIQARLESMQMSLGNDTTNLQAVANRLAQLLEDLPEELADEIGDELRATTTHAAQAVGIETRCSGLYARNLIRDDLAHMIAKLKARLTMSTVPPRPVVAPGICQPSLTEINLTEIGSSTITWDGWGFDIDDPPSLLLRYQSGTVKTLGNSDRTDLIAVGSPFQVTANLSLLNASETALLSSVTLIQPETTSAVKSYAISDGESVNSAIQLNEESTDLSTVAIISPRVVREIREVEIPLQAWGPLFAEPCQGEVNVGVGSIWTDEHEIDSDFKGHGPKIRWSVFLHVERKTITRIVNYEALEWDSRNNRPKHDYTNACLKDEAVIYTVPEGMSIVTSSALGLEDAGTFTDSDTAVLVVSGKVWPIYEIGGDGVGDDVGVYTTIAAPRPTTLKIKLRGYWPVK